MGRWTLNDASKEAQSYIIIVLGIIAVAWLGLGWRAGVMVASAAGITFLATAFAFVDRIAELREDLGKADDELDELDELKLRVCAPPDGWFTFGTHVDRPDVELEFWGEDGGGMPLWERPS